MIYLTRMLGKPVVDAAGEAIGTISDIAIATGEIFPRVTSLAFKGPDKTPFMLSWRKFVASVDDEQVTLNVARPELRFSYLQPDEVLLTRDLLSKQIVDTQGMKVVRVNDLKLSESRNQLRLLGAEVGIRGLLRGHRPAARALRRTRREALRHRAAREHHRVELHGPARARPESRSSSRSRTSACTSCTRPTSPTSSSS